MDEQFSRMQLIYGEDAMKKLFSSRVAVFGIGGVGGYVVEALARCGVGFLDLIDNDTVSLSNINRQIIATQKTVNLYKVDVAKERVKEINPNCVVKTYKTFYLGSKTCDPKTATETASLGDAQDGHNSYDVHDAQEAQFDFSQYDYVVDAIDTVSGKLAIIENSKKANVPVISSMGAGNKIHPEMFEIADIYETSVCPLARVIRSECRKRGIKSLKVVYSKEKPRPLCQGGTKIAGTKIDSAKVVPGSVSFVPSVAGLLIASAVVNDLSCIYN